MSTRNTFFTFVLLLHFGVGHACVIGPEQISIDAVNGFEISIENSDLCASCSQISITALINYKGKPFAHGLFSVYSRTELISKSIHSSVNSAGFPEFVGIANLGDGANYEVTFAYGEGHCMSYEIMHSGNADDS